jgi:hypothetical protein
MPDSSISIRRAQKALRQAASELQELDGRLAALARSIVPQAGRLLPAALRGGAECVSSELLRDAIETLEALAGASEDDVARRRFEIDAAAEQVAAFG